MSEQKKEATFKGQIKKSNTSLAAAPKYLADRRPELQSEASLHLQARMSADRFPMEVKALAMLKHQKTKDKLIKEIAKATWGKLQSQCFPAIFRKYLLKLPICMLSVLWSDQNNILIYRAFEEFEKLHKRLKRQFPIESGILKKSDRTIPTFREVSRVRRKTHKLSCCTEGLKSLQIYCHELLKTQPSISRGEDVVYFFEAQSRDLDPSFPENSIIILPSKTEEVRTQEPAGPSKLTITQPLVAPLYRCLAAFETEDVKMNPFRANRAETLDVLVKDRTGWWLVENSREQRAWFPASHLEKTDEDSVMREASEEGMLYYLTQTYEAKRPDELSVTFGVVVEVLERPDSGWWLIKYNGESGYVPSAFLQPYRNPHRTFLALAPSHLSGSVPNLSCAPRPVGRAPLIPPRGCLDEGVRAHPLHRMREEDLSAQAQSPGTSAGAAGPGWPTETERLAGRLAHLSSQESLWAGASGGRRVKTPPLALGGGGSPCKQPGQASAACLEGSRDLSLGFHWGPTCDRPPVPPRPTPHEILQKCSVVTQRAMWRALREATPDPCPGHPLSSGPVD